MKNSGLALPGCLALTVHIVLLSATVPASEKVVEPKRAIRVEIQLFTQASATESTQKKVKTDNTPARILESAPVLVKPKHSRSQRAVPAARPRPQERPQPMKKPVRKNLALKQVPVTLAQATSQPVFQTVSHVTHEPVHKPVIEAAPVLVKPDHATTTQTTPVERAQPKANIPTHSRPSTVTQPQVRQEFHTPAVRTAPSAITSYVPVQQAAPIEVAPMARNVVTRSLVEHQVAATQRAAPRSREQISKGLHPAILAFLDLIRKKIDETKTYPGSAKRMGMEGTSTLTFTLGPDGSLQAIEVADTSGFDMLDQAAIKTVRKILPLTPPAVVGESPLEIQVPIVFKLE